jgi:hypothetical protein
MRNVGAMGPDGMAGGCGSSGADCAPLPAAIAGSLGAALGASIAGSKVPSGSLIRALAQLDASVSTSRARNAGAAMRTRRRRSKR